VSESAERFFEREHPSRILDKDFIDLFTGKAMVSQHRNNVSEYMCIAVTAVFRPLDFQADIMRE